MRLVSTFAERLRSLLSDDLNMTDLAKRVHTTKQSISRYVNGDREPKHIVLVEIAEVFGVSPAWLAGFDAPKYNISVSNSGNNNAIAAGENCSATVAAEYTPQERELIETFRSLSLADQSKALNYIFRMAKK